MVKDVPELLFLDASRNYRERFEERYFKYSPAQKLETASALLNCATALSKHLGHMPDNIIFGRSVFSRETTERLISCLYELQGQAEERAFQVGFTAVLALQAVASLLMVGHLSKAPIINTHRERELTKMGAHMEDLLEIHRTAR